MTLFQLPPPRDPALVEQPVRRATRYGRAGGWILAVLVALLVSLVLGLADGWSAKIGGTIGVLLGMLPFALPVWLHIRNTRRACQALAERAQVGEARIESCHSFALHGNPVTRVNISLGEQRGVFDLPGSHTLSGVLPALWHADHPRIALVGAQGAAHFARMLPAEQATTGARLRRIAVAVIIGGLLFAGLLLLVTR